jgi:hypothetical protein
MSRLAAIEALIREAFKERSTKTGRKRVERACRALDLDPDETAYVLRLLEYGV